MLRIRYAPKGQKLHCISDIALSRQGELYTHASGCESFRLTVLESGVVGHPDGNDERDG